VVEGFRAFVPVLGSIAGAAYDNEGNGITRVIFTPPAGLVYRHAGHKADVTRENGAC